MLIIIYEIIFITDNLVIIWLFELKKKLITNFYKQHFFKSINSN